MGVHVLEERNFSGHALVYISYNQYKKLPQNRNGTRRQQTFFMYYLKQETLFNRDTGGKISIQTTTKHAVSCLRCRLICGVREVRQP